MAAFTWCPTQKFSDKTSFSETIDEFFYAVFYRQDEASTLKPRTAGARQFYELHFKTDIIDALQQSLKMEDLGLL